MTTTAPDPHILDVAYAALERAGMIRDRDLLALIDLSPIVIKHGHPVVPRDFVENVRAAKPALFAWPEGQAVDAMKAPQNDVDARIAAMKADPAPWRYKTKLPAGVDAMTMSRTEFAAACRQFGLEGGSLR